MNNRRIFLITIVAVVSAIVFHFVNKFFLSMDFIRELQFSNTAAYVLSLIITVIIGIIGGRLILFVLKKKDRI